ncbi:dolichol-phosphate mannosyltransferase subunit 3 [Lampetra fluviatilis]
MTRLSRFALRAASLLGLWAALLVAGPALPVPVRAVLVPLPAYALVLLGCYSLASVGIGLATFGDCPDAAKELATQIGEARRDLASKGFSL